MIKKILITVLSVVCVLCLTVLFGCSSCKKTYYILTFEPSTGITYDCEIKSGAQVKKGYTVTFGVILDDVYAECDYTVYQDSDVLEEDADYVPEESDDEEEGEESSETAADEKYYSFKMSQDTVISVTIDADIFTVTFATSVDDDLGFVRFMDTSGNLLTSLTAANNYEVAFTLQVSVYYLSTYEVQINDEILGDGDDGATDGVYHFTVTEDVDVSLYGLELDSENFTARSDGGSGTESSPYIISRPIDLYQMAMLINSGSYISSGYYLAYYKLANDIDMEGERLYVIGDYTNSGAIFAGSFDGNGHTISNFTITAYRYDDSTSANIFLDYVGLFGYCSATTYGNAKIYNLTLDSYTIDVDETDQGMNTLFFVGSIIGAGIGVNITGCTVTNGEINVECATSEGNSVIGPWGYIGGIAGYLQSGYSTDGTRYYSSVSSCVSGADIIVSTGYAQAIGGIVGILVSAARQANAFVINCYSTGALSGAARTGGIVGHLGAYSSVQNCYSAGSVSAFNEVSISVTADYAYYRSAYAGGIVGYAENETVIADCFTVADINASSTGGTGYKFTDSYVGGGDESATSGIEALEYVVYNCYTSFDKSGLGWDEADWTFGSGYPTINYSSTSKSFTVSVSYAGKTSGSTSQTLSDGYIPMSYCFVLYDNLPEYADVSGYRSYAYYFDSSLKDRVPYGYVPMHDITLYLAFSDYSEIAGQYYFTVGGSSTYIDLNADGTAEFRYGALSLTTYYAYDGGAAYVLDTRIGVLSALVNSGDDYEDDGYYYAYKCVLSADKITLAVSDIQYFISGATDSYGALTAVKYDSTFSYGTYYYKGNDNNVTYYVFEKNGTGTYGGSDMTYTVNSATVTIKVGSTTYTGIVDNGTVTSINNNNVSKCDDFLGSWESKATLNTVYTFDGIDSYTKVVYSYVNDDGTVKYNEVSKVTGSYSVSDNKLTLTISDNENGSDSATLTFSIAYDDAGYHLTTTDGTQNYAYYAEGSYTGDWYFANGKEPVSLTLGGITTEGYGTAVATYSGVTTYTLTYELSDGSLLFYYGDYAFGTLSYDKSANALTGSMYSENSGSVRSNVTFFLYDEYLGYWISDDNTFYLVQFNGFGAYSVKSTSNYIATSGSLTITPYDGNNSTTETSTTVSYTLDSATMSGEFTYNKTTYTISFDTSTGKVTITENSNDDSNTSTYTLQRRDSWYGLELTYADGDGVIYTYSFDGRGALSSSDAKGTLTITSSSGNTSTYSYKVTSSGIEYTKDNETYKIIVSGGSFKLNKNDSSDEGTTLTVNVPFAGSWYVSGQTDKNGATGKIVIDSIKASLDSSGEISSLTASGKFLGTEVTYTYHADGQYLTFTYNGSTVYVNYYPLDSGCELYLGTVNSLLAFDTVCIAATDGCEGYMASSDGSYRLVFDGFGKSTLGSGTAYIYYGNLLINSHTYSVDDSGVITLDQGTYVLTSKSVESRNIYSGISFVKDSTSYIIAYVDIMYGRAMAAEDDKYFDFDGLGTVDIDGTSYTYEYEASNSDSSFYHTLVYIYGSNGSVCRIAYPYNTANYDKIIYIDDLYYVSATDSNGYTYTFNGDSVGGLFADCTTSTKIGNGTCVMDSSSVAFTYKITRIDSANDWYYVTITMNGSSFNAIVKGGDTNSLELV